MPVNFRLQKEKNEKNLRTSLFGACCTMMIARINPALTRREENGGNGLLACVKLKGLLLKVLCCLIRKSNIILCVLTSVRERMYYYYYDTTRFACRK